MNYSALLEEIKNQVTNMFISSANKGLLYHNLEHTQFVVSNTITIANYYKLNDEDFFIVTSAAWFHDVGYCLGDAAGHELAGANMAKSFLSEKGLPTEVIEKISNCILATRIPQQPKNLLEQIICDGDLYHFGTDEFSERNKLMRKEAALRLGKKISKTQWRNDTIAMMQEHHFSTGYGQTFLQDKKLKNLEQLQQKSALSIEKTNFDTEKNNQIELANVTHEKKAKNNRPERGIETMFRITASNNQRLSDMADNKANIMITTTSIIISVLLSVLIRKLEENPNLTIPAIVLLLVCVATMVLSILSIRPKLPPGTFTDEDIKTKKVNLLFFGNFYNMPLESYAAGINEVMNDREFLYGSLTKDIYFQGAVLGKKYKLLRLAYNIFMFGIMLSIAAFIIASLIPS